MNHRKLLLSLVALALVASATAALAVPSCTDWMKQPNGTSWRTCVDDNGKQYCEESKNGKVTRVKCT